MAAPLTIAGLIDAGHLQRTAGHAAHAGAFLGKANERVGAARDLLENYPEPAFVLSFSAVRSALLGVLARHDIALTDTCRDRSDWDNDSGIFAAVAELVGAERFPELNALWKVSVDREYGDDIVDRQAACVDAPRWVSSAEVIVATAAELITT